MSTTNIAPQQQQYNHYTKYECICQPLLVVVACCLNFPPLIFGARGFAEWCEAFSTWLIGNACLSALNILAAFYSVYKLRRNRRSEIMGVGTDGEETDGIENASRHNMLNGSANGGGNDNNNVDNDHPSHSHRLSHHSSSHLQRHRKESVDQLMVDVIDTEAIDIEKNNGDQEEDTDSNEENESGSSQEDIHDDNHGDGHNQDDDSEENVGIPMSPSGRSSTRRSSNKNRRGCFSRLIHLRTTSSDRIRHLICYDGILVSYSILFLVWIFWLSDGIQQYKIIDEMTTEELEGCQEFHFQYTYVSLVCGFTYFTFVMLAVLLSLFSTR